MHRKAPVYIRYLILLFIIYILITSSCVSTEPSLFNKMKIRVKHYENLHYAVTLDYPADWYFKEKDGLLFASVASFDIFSDGGTGLAIIRFTKEEVQKEFENMTLDKVINSFINQLYADSRDIADAMIGGVESRQAEFTISQEKTISGEINILIFKQHVYIFMAVANPSKLMNKNKQVFKAIYESIEFIQDRDKS